MNDSALTLPQLKNELDSVKTELKAEIGRLDAKIDTVKTDLERKLDDRTSEVLDTIRETAEMIDARQERRASATLVAQRQWLQDHVDKQVTPLFSDQARTRGALDEHLRDDTRHLKPRAPKTAR